MKEEKQMKNILSLLLLASIVFLGACNTNSNSQTGGTKKNISAKEFKEKTEQTPGIILDVRTPAEVATGVIPGAITIDWNGGDFEAQVDKLDKDQPVYVYCKSGGRSSGACSKMQGMGFKELYNLEGGITAWRSAGYSTASPSLSKGEE